MGPDTIDTAGLAPAGGDRRACIALVAHDHKKRDLVDWCRANREQIAPHRLVATGTTGAVIAGELGLEIERLRSGPLGGDLQLGAMIAEGRIDALLFFWDPLEPQPHDPDVRALLRIAVVWNVPVACNLSTADLLFASSLLATGYRRRVPPYPDTHPVGSGPA
jgi:methylglyoxal synthase